MRIPRERLDRFALALIAALMASVMCGAPAVARTMAARMSHQPPERHSDQAAGATGAAAGASRTGVLAFDPPSVEFGAMYVGKTRHAKVKVTNASDGPVTISRAIPGCSCTRVSEAPTEPMAAGASFMLDVSLDGGDYGGTKLRKVVNFVIDGRPTEFLWLHGDVQQVIAVNPQVLDVRHAADGDTLTVRLESVRFADFVVRGVEPAGIARFGTEPSTEQELAIDVAALKAAGMPTKLTVRTDHTDADTIFVLLRVPLPPSPQGPAPPAPPAATAPPAPPAPPSPPPPPPPPR